MPTLYKPLLAAAAALLIAGCGNSVPASVAGNAPPVVTPPSPGPSPMPTPNPSPAPAAPVDNSPPPEAASLDTMVLQDVPTMAVCDFLNREYCQFPWPSNFFTVADATTDTGLRVNLNAALMPKNVGGVAINPADWNRNDGFSPGQAILARVPDVDLVKTGAAPLTDVGASLFSTAPIAVYDLGATADATPLPHLVYAELDANLTAQPAANPLVDAGPALTIRPAKNFLYGHRYAVVLRNLKDSSGALLEAPAAFRIYRDNHASSIPMVSSRRAGFEALFQQLGKAGIKRSELYMAWDFTIASERNLTERLVHMRDDAFASIGPASPAFTIDAVINNPENREVSDITARRIRGHVTVPCYLNTPNCISGGTLNYTPGAQGQFGDGLPDRIGSGTPLAATASVPFICSIPRKTYNGAADPAAATAFTAARPSLYGHGLLGTRDEGNTYDFNVRHMAQEHNFVFCMVDWAGMATGNLPDDPEGDPMKYDPAWDAAGQDLTTVGTLLAEMGQFSKLGDRVQQGVLNFMFLGRAMIHPAGLCTNAAFQVNGECVLDTTELFYDGNSQGGIIGGVLMAVSPDIKSGTLGVPGMNYSTLLQRSVDFDTYAQIFYNAYPTGLDQQFVLSLIQMLWDRAENNGYAETLAPGRNLPGVPPKRVLLHPGFSDHQVTMWTAEVMARSVEAGVHCPAVVRGPRAQRGPAVASGVHPDVQAEAEYLAGNGAMLRTPHPMSRHPDDEPYFAMPCLMPGHSGNALVVWDRGPRTAARDDGAVPPPTDNTPPRPGLGYGGDPHGDPRNEVLGRVQKNEWLKPIGRYVDVCEGKPCVSRGFVP
ncbi:MAG: hypothetical protein V4709_12190 [Pseudomonadota bacterium]